MHRFGRALATALLDRFPNELTVSFAKADRGDRIYLDLARNSYGSTIAAPYGVRAIEGGPIAAPITWNELDQALVDRLTPRSVTLRGVFDRLDAQPDPWADMDRWARPVPARDRQ